MKKLSRWQKLRSRQRSFRWKKLAPKMQLARAEGSSLQGSSEACPPENLKSGPLRMHFQHSGAKIRVFEQNTDIITKFWLFYSATAHE